MKTVVLYGDKMDYDHVLDFNILSEDVTVYPDADETKLLERLGDAEILITKENLITSEMINSFPSSLKLIIEAGTGYNNIDVIAAREKGITVCNVPAYSTERVVETALMFILNMSSEMRKQIAKLEKGDHSNFTNYLAVSHHEIYNKTLGIIGAGRIGLRVAEVAKCFGMKVIAYTRTPKEDNELLSYVDLETLLKESDYISLHCPLTDKTKHIINEETLKLMKPTAYLINTARGPLIDEKALIKALNENIIAGAAIDVQEIEPFLDNNPLYDMANVITTPHMGWKAVETRERMVSIIADDIKAYREGNPINVVN